MTKSPRVATAPVITAGSSHAARPEVLRGLMFSQLLAYGSVGPVLSSWLDSGLGFTGFETGAIMATSMIASIVSPLVAMYVIDRKLSGNHVLAMCHALQIGLNLLLMQTTNFWAFFVMYLLLSALQGPTLGLVNSLTFANLKGGSRTFGGIRVFGTLGWIAAAWILGGVWALIPLIWPGVDPLAWQKLIFLLAALGSLAAMLFALRLQPAALRSDGPRRFLPPGTLQVFLRPSILGLGLIYLLSAIMDRFYFFGAAPYLQALQVGPGLVMPLLTLGQITEIATLFTMAKLLHRWGYRKVLLLGLAFQIARFSLLAGGQLWIAVIGVSLNGFIFAYVYSLVSMYIDEHTDTTTRPGVHQLLVVLFGGSSSLIGNLAAGLLRQAFPADMATQGAGAWAGFWLIPLAISIVLSLAAFLLFPRSSELVQKPPVPAAGGTTPAAPEA